MYEKDKTFRSNHIASFCLSGCRVSVFPNPVHGTGADHPGKREMTGMAGFFRTEDRAFGFQKKWNANVLFTYVVFSDTI